MAKQQNHFYRGILLIWAMLFCAEKGVACPFEVWLVARDEESERFFDLEYGNGRFVAVGFELLPEQQTGGIILWSDDGVSWAKSAIDLKEFGRVSNVEFGNGMWLAVNKSTGGTLRSSNGADWERGPSAVEHSSGFLLSDQNFVLGNFSGPVLKSEEGLDWLEIHPQTEDRFFYSAAIIGATVFLLGEKNDGFGAGFLLRQNQDGSWKEVAGPWRGRLMRMAHREGRYVIAGYFAWGGEFGNSEATIYISDSGEDWREIALNRNRDDWFAQFEVMNGLFVGVTDSGRVLRSIDGEFWREHAGFAASRPTRIVRAGFGKNRYVFLTTDGIVVSPEVSQPCLEIVPELPEHILEVLGAAGREYEVEVSSDLKTWKLWKRFVAEQGATLIESDPEAGKPALFFRSKLISADN